ncbi:MAG TPA: 50S ribosomal protein L32, partial [Ruminococcaceae bacterium]|nr:50S ribosomal protein L32 [Oscillospiraceae bacterium]
MQIEKEVLEMAVPKRKQSSARQNKRRSNVWKM